MMDAYRSMLIYIKSAVSHNYSEKHINSIMDFVAGSTNKNCALLRELYETTLEALKEAPNESLWFKINLKLCKLLSDDIVRMNKILKELHKTCQNEDDSDDLDQKSTQLLEIYAVEIEIYIETGNDGKLMELYDKVLNAKGGVAHPRIRGITHEGYGKVHMAKQSREETAFHFFAAFINYAEVGDQKCITCLKYFILAKMLMGSSGIIIDDDEPYMNNPEILVWTNLAAAYERNDILEFEKIVKNNRSTIMDDPFIRNYIEDILNNVREQGLLKRIKP